MDKSVIKNYAIWARRKLIEDITQKAFEYGITEQQIIEAVPVSSDTVQVGGKLLQKTEAKQRASLVERIREKGFTEVMEEAAYTWFNRIIAIRFMEVNEYLPIGVRVLSSIDTGKAVPDIVTHALHLDLDLNLEKVNTYLDNHNDDELFRYLFVKQCNKLNEILPYLFETIEDYTEILLPNNLLIEGSVIRRLVEGISEVDFKKQVEIIGWLYQYYIIENNELIYDGSMIKNRITKELLPAATQIFTPDWVVNYMVENSLGRLAFESLNVNEDIKHKWKYFIENGELNKGESLKIEEIKILDPAMGSGHMLVYAFDLLIEIYKSLGYTEREATKHILQNNLYGLDIDDRAFQLAYFAVMMKAREHDRRIFNENIKPHLYSIQESNTVSSDLIDFATKSDNTLKANLEYIVDIFKDAKEYGSIIKIKSIDFNQLNSLITLIKDKFTDNLFTLTYKEQILTKLSPLIKQAELMSKKYDVVVTNPPYLNNSRMSKKLLEYVNENYPDTKADFCMIFYQKAIDDYCRKDGFIAFITTTSWMFLKTFEKLRKKVVEGLEFESLVDFGTELFEGKVGHNPIVAWINKNCKPTKKMSAISLTKYCYSRRDEKKEEFFNDKNRYISDQKDFLKIDGMPIAYWVTERVRTIFEKEKSIRNIANPCIGMRTGDNSRFLRYWYEINWMKMGCGFENKDQAKKSGLKWFPYNKGGDFRKWYGNNEYVVNWENDGEEIKENTRRVYPQLGNNLGWKISNEQYYFRVGITWSFVSSSYFGVRYSPRGFIFDVGGSSLFPPKEIIYYLIAFLCSKLSTMFMIALNPTMNFQVCNVAALPIVIKDDIKSKIDDFAIKCIEISKTDWDNFETSWDFIKHPLLTYKILSGWNDDKEQNSGWIKQSYQNWEAFTEHQFIQLKANEEELNRIFIEIYSLKDELTPEVEEKDITIRRADLERDIKSFISYAVGCIFGRYSLDVDGLVYAGGEWDSNKYKSFIPDFDNVIPITDDEYFNDDIIGRFIEFVKVTFGAVTHEENLDFIANALGNKGNTSREVIRQYFIKDFYKDHVKIYQKKPIYWLFDSGKENGFKALIYIHRYDVFTVAKVRTDYLHRLQKMYEAEYKRCDILIDGNVSEHEKAVARKKKEKLQKQIQECLAYDQVIAHVANQRIKIDLDDGVSVNYAKFQEVEVPQGEGRKPVKADLLSRI